MSHNISISKRVIFEAACEIGAEVSIRGTSKMAIVTQIIFTGSDVQYLVAWFDDDSRNSVWLYEFELNLENK